MQENSLRSRRMDGLPRPLSEHRHLRRALHAGDVGAWEWHVPEELVHVDPSIGVTLQLVGGVSTFRTSDLFALMEAEDVRLFRIAMTDALVSDEVFSQDIRIHVRGKADPVWLCNKGSVTERDGQGGALIVAGITFDVSDRRRAQEQQELVNRELSHRMKNVLSVVNSLVTMTAEHSPAAEGFAASLKSRLAGLATAQDLLVRAEWDNVALPHLIERTMAALGVLGRVNVVADDIALNPRDTQTLVLVLHELATNAIKYGALSDAHGRVDVECRIDAAEGTQVLAVAWKERDGPSVAPPHVKGFGVALLERLTRRQSAPYPLFVWDKGGLLCRFQLRIAI